MTHGRPLLLTSCITFVMLLSAACAGEQSADTDELANNSVRSMPASASDSLFTSLQSLCGNAYEGVVIEDSSADSAFASSTLVMHVRECNDSVLHIPFHVGENRSRTWVVTKTVSGLRLKHDHRHEDGTEDSVTQYGGDTQSVGTARVQEFPADAFTASLIPAASTNVWTMEMQPGTSFVYALRREGTDRRFRVQFDLTRTAATPPAPWGWQ